jgi:hypothetical protein
VVFDTEKRQKLIDMVGEVNDLADKQELSFRLLIEFELQMISFGIKLIPIETHDKELMIKGLMSGIKSVMSFSLDADFIDFLKDGFFRLVEKYKEHQMKKVFATVFLVE